MSNNPARVANSLLHDNRCANQGGKTYRIRKAGEPEELQKTIYQKLNVNWEVASADKTESGWLIDSSDPKGQCIWCEGDIENSISSDV